MLRAILVFAVFLIGMFSLQETYSWWTYIVLGLVVIVILFSDFGKSG